MRGKWGDGQHNKRGGRGATQDQRVADDIRQAMQGDLAADGMTRGHGWRTCCCAHGNNLYGHGG